MTCQNTVLMVFPTVDTAPRCDNGDERAEQPVLEKILTVFLAAQPPARDALQPGNSNRQWHDSTPPVDPAKRWGRHVRTRRPTIVPTIYAAAASCPAMLLKMADTLCPARATAPIAINAMSATSNAYSSRSWPSSLRNRLHEIQ